MSNNLEGEYVLIDGKSTFRGGKFREFQKIKKTDTAHSSYRQGPMRAQNLFDLMKGNNKYHTVPAENVPEKVHVAGAQWPLKWLRVPSQDVQTRLLDFDAQIAKLQAEKEAYMQEIVDSGIHMEWDFPTVEDFPFKRIEDKTTGKWSTIHKPCGQTLHYDPTGKDNETTEIHVTKTCPLLVST